VGRDAGCDLPLEDPTLSRHHFELQWDGTTYQLTDHSRNGTFVDGERITASCPLHIGSHIEVGELLFEYAHDQVEHAPTTLAREYHPTLVLKFEPQSHALTIERIALTVEYSPDRRGAHTFDFLPINIGASPQNHLIVTNDPYISRQHCRIESDRDGILLRDCDSRNGTWWGGQQVRSKLLPERGSFQVGRTTVSYHVEVVQETIAPTTQHRCGELLTANRAMQEIFALVARVAPSDVTVLITGESGTGKELLARALHAGSGRAIKPFVAVNCGAIPATIIESELFGHERGAFTGASAQHRGVFEQAQGGTLFLDELGEMPLDLQTRLLRVLETRTVRRVGGTADQPIDCRIVAATNRRLGEMVAAGQFREDLYYRLYNVPMNLPPLRERPEDITLLTHQFLQAAKARDRELEIAPEAMQVLLAHPWPGNVRELRHTIDRAIMAATGSCIEVDDLHFTPQPCAPKSAGSALTAGAHPLRDHERSVVEEAIRKSKGNLAKTARILGIARSSLYAKLRHWALDISQLREVD